MNERVIDIHIPASATPIPDADFNPLRINNWGRATLARSLQQLGQTVSVTRGAAAFRFESSEVNTLVLDEIRQAEDGYVISVNPHTLAVDSLTAIRNVAAALGNDVPELNHPRLRAITRDKVETNRVLQAIGLAKASTAYDPGESLAEKIDGLPGDYIVAKPRNGKQGNGVTIDSKQSMLARFESGELTFDQPMVLEERLNMHVPMRLKGINDEEQRKIDTANEGHAAKELRAYYFGKDEAGEAQIQYVLRVAKKGMGYLHHDDWVFIDQDSVPDELFDATAQVASALSRASQVDELHIGVDWAHAETSEGNRYWVPMEVNGGEPQLVYENQHAPTARLHADMLARQLVRIGDNGGTIYNKEHV